MPEITHNSTLAGITLSAESNTLVAQRRESFVQGDKLLAENNSVEVFPLGPPELNVATGVLVAKGRFIKGTRIRFTVDATDVDVTLDRDFEDYNILTPLQDSLPDAGTEFNPLPDENGWYLKLTDADGTTLPVSAVVLDTVPVNLPADVKALLDRVA